MRGWINARTVRAENTKQGAHVVKLLPSPGHSDGVRAAQGWGFKTPLVLGRAFEVAKDVEEVMAFLAHCPSLTHSHTRARREIWFLCRFYSAAEAFDMGLVNKVVPLPELEAETVRWCACGAAAGWSTYRD